MMGMYEYSSVDWSSPLFLAAGTFFGATNVSLNAGIVKNCFAILATFALGRGNCHS